MKKRIIGAILMVASLVGLASCSLGFVVPTTTTMDLKDLMQFYQKY